MGRHTPTKADDVLQRLVSDQVGTEVFQFAVTYLNWDVYITANHLH